MAVPVLNTFIHFPIVRQTRRCRSSPPECQVHLAIREAVAVAISTMRTRRRRPRGPPQDDQAIIAEFRSLAVCDKWAMLKQKLANQFRRVVWAEARRLMIAFKAAQRVPQFQEAIGVDLFKQIANCLDIWHGEFLILVGAGTLRPRDRTIEIWAPESDKSQRQQDLLAYAKRFNKFVANGDFVLRYPKDGGVGCSPIQLAESMTVKWLKRIAAVASGIAPRKQRMSHLGEELRSGRLLRDNRVMPGSCIIVTRIRNY